MIRQMVMACSKILMEANMKDSGKMINNMVLAKKSGTMGQKLTKVNF